MSIFSFFKDKTPPLVTQALDNMKEMLETTEEMYSHAVSFLLENTALTIDLEKKDIVVNELERHIRRIVLEHITIDPEHDLTFSLTLISLVQDAERIGDLTKSLVKTANLAHQNRMGDTVNELRGASEEIKALFAKVIEAFVNSKIELANEVMQASDTIKLKLTNILRSIANDDKLSTNEAVVLAVSTRMLSRISSHLSNIASSVALPFDKIRRTPSWEDDE